MLLCACARTHTHTVSHSLTRTHTTHTHARARTQGDSMMAKTVTQLTTMLECKMSATGDKCLGNLKYYGMAVAAKRMENIVAKRTVVAAKRNSFYSPKPYE